eukprot:4741877-Pyramimonas_sp.AAC.1
MPLSSAPHLNMCVEYSTAWIFEKNPTTEEEARGCMSVFAPLTRNDWVLGQRRRDGLYGTM